ncbi:MAG TPA: 3' terminal RNA ribose 2'-O-methyltransferase Hen1 [Chloroflexota bacterium]|nr:3' terminal RNA ribose 2'-O-methyltransferase Hen1 [Chloroflexota bacterium]
MLLTITTTRPPATDLGYLLHKHPGRAQSFDLSFGKAHVLYPEASAGRCTAALLLDVDPVGLVRRRGAAPEGHPLQHYVNDRPYVASSFLSVAVAQVYGSALAGRSRERPDLVETELPLEATLAVLPCRDGEGFLRRLFEPLGYELQAEGHLLDPSFPEWGASRYYTVHLRATTRLQRLLTHLYVLVPVLDDDKHYWVGDDEVDKLLRRGEGWLAGHPEREAIISRYLRHQGQLTRAALARLVDEDVPDPDAVHQAHGAAEAAVEEGLGLGRQRVAAVLAALQASGARRVADLGCGEGRLLEALLDEGAFDELVGLDVSLRSLELAARRLQLERLPAERARRVKLMQGALTYRDRRLQGYDAATLVEVVEHLDPSRLAAFERVQFGFTRPRTIVLTTPNAEYNVRFPLAPGAFRHEDHRFEWTREAFQSWAGGVARQYGYAVRFQPVGPEDPALGAPTQMAVFTLRG